MAGNFISREPKNYDNFQHVTSTIPMSCSSTTLQHLLAVLNNFF